jgi:hypothetical protein
MTDEMRIQSAEEYLLNHLREAGQALSTEDLDRWRRTNKIPLTPSDVQGAMWNLVQRGKAAFTHDRLLKAVAG